MVMCMLVVSTKLPNWKKNVCDSLITSLFGIYYIFMNTVVNLSAEVGCNWRLGLEISCRLTGAFYTVGISYLLYAVHV